MDRVTASDTPRLVSLSLQLASANLADFLAVGQGRERIFWESDAEDVAFAGIGVVDQIAAWGPGRYDQIERQARALFHDSIVLDETEPLAAPRLFGGFAFDDNTIADHTWTSFPPALFLLPHYQLAKAGGTYWLTINSQIEPGEDPMGIRDSLSQALTVMADLLAGYKRAGEAASEPQEPTINYPMSYQEWQNAILEATRRMDAGSLVKVVLARVCELRFAHRVDVVQALRRLAAQYPDTYRFLFEPRTGHAFFGASPELLIGQRDVNLRTMALAGSARRGGSEVEDDRLGQELLADAKERNEHQIVIAAIQERLSPLTEYLEIGTTDLLRLANIQHLYTPVTARLAQPRSVIEMIAYLHPTPALGGVPSDAAWQMMREAEPVTRGWYGAPVGWLDRDLNGDFAVAIRSTVVQENRAWLYAGAGIVPGSQPAREWQETGLKLQPMLSALDVREAIHAQPG
jgi:menaquinone-specific isochorismate synthase